MNMKESLDIYLWFYYERRQEGKFKKGCLRKKFFVKGGDSKWHRKRFL
jgi:hypothetical protein